MYSDYVTVFKRKSIQSVKITVTSLNKVNRLLFPKKRNSINTGRPYVSKCIAVFSLF